MNYHDSTFEDLDNLVHSRARHLAKRFGLPWSQHGPDLVQTGWLGCVRASKRYESVGWKFSTYAYWFISGDIRRACVSLATSRHLNTTMDEAYDVPSTDDPDFDTALRELLKSPDGLELLAAELGHRDASKFGVQIRAEALSSLRQRYNRITEAAA